MAPCSDLALDKRETMALIGLWREGNMRTPGLFTVNSRGVTFGAWLAETCRVGTTVDNIAAWIAG